VNPGEGGGLGNVPYPRTEYLAEQINAYFNVDLAQIKSLGLIEEAQQLLIKLAIYKAQKCLREEMRLRTACDLKVVDELSAKDERGNNIELESLENLEREIPELIKACQEAGTFVEPAVTEIEIESKK
jgi:CRISPR-associated protein Csb1